MSDIFIARHEKSASVLRGRIDFERLIEPCWRRLIAIRVLSPAMHGFKQMTRVFACRGQGFMLG